MAFATLIMQNPLSGNFKNAPVGFSWTSLFFGGFVPLTRGHYSGFVFWFLLMVLSGGLSLLVQAFIYNRQYLKYLVNTGYKVKHSSTHIDMVSSKVNLILPMIEEDKA